MPESEKFLNDERTLMMSAFTDSFDALLAHRRGECTCIFGWAQFCPHHTSQAFKRRMYKRMASR